jgi:hypothetical protein
LWSQVSPFLQNHAYSIRRAIQHKKGCFKIGAGEKKILIVLLYYVLLVEFSLMAFTLATTRIQQFRTAVKLNFFCESPGFNPDAPCDRTLIDDLKFPEVNLLAYMLLELFPVINFIYVIKFRVVKKWCCRYVLKRESQSSYDMTTEYTSTGGPHSRTNSVSWKRAQFAGNSTASGDRNHSLSVALPEMHRVACNGSA